MRLRGLSFGTRGKCRQVYFLTARKGVRSRRRSVCCGPRRYEFQAQCETAFINHTGLVYTRSIV